MSPACPRRCALRCCRFVIWSCLLGPLAFLAVGLLVLAYWWLDPDSAQIGHAGHRPRAKRLRRVWQALPESAGRRGHRSVRLLPSDGSVGQPATAATTARQTWRCASVALSLLPDDPENLVSLGSLFVEPVWVLYRTEAAQRMYERPRLDGLRQSRGMRVNVGSEGSGVPWLMNQLLGSQPAGGGCRDHDPAGRTPATVAFLAGKLDALVFASAPESLMVQMLLQTPGVQLLDIAQHEAYARRFPFLSPVDPAPGCGGPGQRRASAGRAHGGIHHVAAGAGIPPTGLAHAVCTAREQVHSTAGWFNRAREFPNMRHSELPIAKEGERAINEPVPMLQRYLPFWLANLIERMWLVLGILLAALPPRPRRTSRCTSFGRALALRLPLVSAACARSKTRWSPNPDKAPQMLQALDALEAQVEKVTVPLSYADELYALRNHIHLIRKKLMRP